MGHCEGRKRKKASKEQVSSTRLSKKQQKRRKKNGSYLFLELPTNWIQLLIWGEKKSETPGMSSLIYVIPLHKSNQILTHKKKKQEL